MTSVSEAIIQSPVDAIWMDQRPASLDQSSLGGEGQGPTHHTQPRPVQKQPGTDKTGPMDYLLPQKESPSRRPVSLVNPPNGGAAAGPLTRSMLRPDGLSDSSQDSTPGAHQTSLGKGEARSDSTARLGKQVRYKPRTPHSRQQERAQSLSHTGPHCYECCPRKTTTTTQSLVSQTSREDIDSSNCQSFMESAQVPEDDRPPFVVRHVTEDLISKRDFPRTQSHPYTHRTGYLFPASTVHSGQPSSTGPQQRHQPTFSELYRDHLLRSTMTNGEASAKKLTTSHKAQSLPSSPRRTVTADQLTYIPRLPSSARRPLHNSLHHNTTSLDSSGVGDLSESSLQEQAGNMRQGRPLSPSHAIRERIGRLMEECCQCTVSVCHAGLSVVLPCGVVLVELVSCAPLWRSVGQACQLCSLVV